jgi:transposase
MEIVIHLLCKDLETLANKLAKKEAGIVIRDETIEELKAEKAVAIAIRDEENELLRERIRLLQAKLFMPSSEKLKHIVSADQLALFDEEEVSTDKPTDEDDEGETRTTKVRKRGGRKPIPDFLPRREILHDLSDKEKICACGRCRTLGGEDVTEELEYIPPTLEVLHHIWRWYVCKACEKAEEPNNPAVLAPKRLRMIPGIMAGPSLLAHIMTSKFADGMPFYRVSKQSQRLGLEISRANMSNWARSIGTRLMPLWELLLQECKTRDWLQFDETRVQVHKEEGKTNQSLSYMWVIRAGPVEKPIILYKYDPTREGRVARELLEGYKGYVQTDAYAGYDFLAKSTDMRHVGDWDHVHRKFAEAVQARSKKKSATSKLTYAEIALKKIARIYRIEKEARLGEHDDASVAALRQSKAKPLIEDFEIWLRDLAPKTPKSGLLGKAIFYTLKIWPRLSVYLEDGNIPISTTYVENAIRPFVIGRKGWLFCGSPRGAHASAVIYSMIETAKANGWEPFAYLSHLFNKLPLADSEDAVRSLLPTVPPK